MHHCKNESTTQWWTPLTCLVGYCKYWPIDYQHSCWQEGTASSCSHPLSALYRRCLHMTYTQCCRAGLTPACQQYGRWACCRPQACKHACACDSTSRRICSSRCCLCILLCYRCVGLHSCLCPHDCCFNGSADQHLQRWVLGGRQHTIHLLW